MILALIVIVPALIASLVVYFKTSPEVSDQRKVSLYNFGTIASGSFLSVFFALRIRAAMIDGSDSAWWPYLAAIFSPIVLIGTVFMSGLVRNFIVFRKK